MSCIIVPNLVGLALHPPPGRPKTELSELLYCDMLVKTADEEAKSVHCLQDSGGRNFDLSENI